MYDFKMSLERVPTTHGQRITNDLDRCSQAYCRNFDLGRRELADPNTISTLPRCLQCQTLYSSPICRGCVAARSCNLCNTFICPDCISHLIELTKGYNIDTYFELADLTSPQPWLDILSHELIARDCGDPQNSKLGAKATLMNQQVHRHFRARESAVLSIQGGFVD